MGKKKFRKHIKMLEWQLESETRWAKDYFDNWQKSLREITALEKENERLVAVGSQIWELIDQRDSAENEVDTLRQRLAELKEELDTARVGRSVRQQQIEQQDELMVSTRKFIDSLEESHGKLSNRITELEEQVNSWRTTADRYLNELQDSNLSVSKLVSESGGMRRLLNALCLRVGDMPIWDDAEEESAYHFEWGKNET